MDKTHQLNDASKVANKWPLQTVKQNNGTDVANGRKERQCGKKKIVHQEGNGQNTNQPPREKRVTPRNQELEERPTANQAQLEPLALAERPHEEELNTVAKPEQVAVNKRLEELITQKTQTEVHLQTLKRKSQVIYNTSNRLKQEVRERYNEIRRRVMKDEQTTIELLEEDTRITAAKLNKAINEGNRHLEKISKFINSLKTESQQREGASTQQGDDLQEYRDFNEKTCPAKQFAINSLKFQRLLKLLQNISENLQTKLIRTSLLLDQVPVLLDTKTSNKNIFISSDQTGMCLVSEPQNVSNSPLRFDTTYNVLGSSGWLRGRHYWEIDVRSSPAWSIGMAYGSIERKGKQKSAKLGRNRLSWSVELKDSKLLAWHNDKSIVCDAGNTRMKQVGVHVDCERSQIVYYNAENMKVIQEFSSSTAHFFDRLQHRFNEAVYPALCLFPPKSGTLTFERLQICNSYVEKKKN